jgi:hypothetical protein
VLLALAGLFLGRAGTGAPTALRADERLEEPELLEAR